MAGHHDPYQCAFYRSRDLCLEEEETHVVLYRSTVKEDEIADIPGYNRANGIMWLVFSAVFWISTVLGCHSMAAGGIFLMAGSIITLPLLPFIYSKI